MRKKIRICASVMAAVCFISMTACGGSGTGEESPVPTESQIVQPTKEAEDGSGDVDKDTQGEDPTGGEDETLGNLQPSRVPVVTAPDVTYEG